ncbi:MAG: glycosyltransferase family 4 protein [Niabella sp.]
MMKKRILIIENSLYLTGAFNAILQMAAALKAEYDFIFVIPEKSNADIAFILGQYNFPVYKIPFIEISKSLRTLNYIPRLYRNAYKIKQIAIAERVDAIHVNDFYNLAGCAVKKLLPSVKLVYHVRLLRTSYIGPMYSFYAKRVKKYADGIICVSEAVKKDFGGAHNVQVIYDTVKIVEKHPAWQGLKDDAVFRILYLGNYVKGKGQNFGLQAFIEFKKQCPVASIKFVGAVSGEASVKFKNNLIQQAIAANVADDVIFADATNDVEKEMKAHDVVLNLSESESFSFVTLEAISYGVPIVVSNSGGPAEITDHGTKAKLVINKDHTAAAMALSEIFNDKAIAIEKANSSKLWVQQYFDSDISINKIRNLYNRI